MKNNKNHIKQRKIKNDNNIIIKTIKIIKSHKIIIIICSLVLVLSAGIGTVLFVKANSKKIGKAHLCLVKFDSAGGTLMKSRKFNCGEKIQKPESVPEKEGFQFIGWTYLNQAFDFDKIVNEDIILVANYNPLDEKNIVKIYFDTDGGSSIKPIEALIKSTITAPLDPSKNGYIFNGWYLDGKKFDFKTPILQNITLKASWKKDTASNSSVSTKNNRSIKETSKKYKCSASYSSVVEENKVNTDYNDHVNWTFNTDISYSSDDCYITYRSSDNSVATVSNNGIIKALKKGSTYIYECINDNETKKEVGCFKGKLNVVASQFDQEKEKAMTFAKAVNGYYWYLDGDNYAYLHPSIINWYDHTALNWDSKFIALSNNKLVTSSSTNVMYKNDDAIHNSFLANPTELGYHIISQYNMKASGSKLYITVGGKTYSFTKNTSEKNAKVSLSLSQNNLTLDKGSSKIVKINISPMFLSHNVVTTSSNPSVVSCSGNSSATNGSISLTCSATKAGSANVTVKDTVGGNSTILNITVNNVIIPVTGISLNKTSLNLTKGNTSTLVATIYPANADNRNITWTSSNSSVATVSNGKVTAVGAGTANIIATTQDGNKTATCNVVVTNPAISAKANIGVSTIATNNGLTRGVSVNVVANGGTGTFIYYYIKLYKEGTLIGKTSNTSSNSIFVAGYANGSYYAEFEVHDSSGTVFSGKSGTITISGF